MEDLVKKAFKEGKIRADQIPWAWRYVERDPEAFYRYFWGPCHSVISSMDIQCAASVVKAEEAAQKCLDVLREIRIYVNADPNKPLPDPRGLFL